MNDLPQDFDLQLLLYAGDELPPAARAAVERRLSGDPEAQRRLEALRQTIDATAEGLAAMDAAEPIDLRVRGIERSIPRLIRQWQVDRATLSDKQRDARGGAAGSAHLRRVPVWLYPLATAAAVLLVLGVWSLVLSEEDAASPLAGDSGLHPSIPHDGLGPAAIAMDDGDDADSTGAPESVPGQGPIADAVLQRYEAMLAALKGIDAPDLASPAALASTWWNPLRDVGGEELASLERDLAKLQVLDYAFR